jgi:hypothetical protein
VIKTLKKICRQTHHHPKYNFCSANRLVCQNTLADISAGPTGTNKTPYLTCADDAKLMIQKAELILSTRDMCPLQYTGADMGNVQTECLPPFNLFMTDATTILKALYLIRA